MNTIRKSLKHSRGITLIALVITIIVLLLLAGISIVMLSGENGILRRTADAKVYTYVTQIQERINLAYHSALVDGQGEVAETLLETALKKEFNKTSLGEDWLDKTSVEGKWKITIDGISLEVPARKQNNQDNDKVTIKIGSTNIKEISNLTTSYGEITDYTSVDDVQWQLFFDDTDYIYLIASDYVLNSKLPIIENNGKLLKSTNTTKDYKDYSIVFSYGYNDNQIESNGHIIANTPYNNGIESNTITENPQTNKYLKWVYSNVINKKNNMNINAVAYMMDTNEWGVFAGNVSGAYAIGGPTLEMYTLSYNAKHDTKLGTYGTNIEDISATNANENGYKVKLETGSWSNYVGGLDSSSDNMWVKVNSNKSAGYFLSSPSSNGAKLCRIVSNSGYIDSIIVAPEELSQGRYGIRPLIAIPKSSLK